MKLATARLDGRTAAVRIDADEAVEVGFPDVGALLNSADWNGRAATADGPRYATAELDYAPVVPRPAKIICVGLNYRAHILELGLPIPVYPTLFAKFAPSLIGPFDDIELCSAATKWDWEVELAVVVGAHVRHVDPEAAAAAIAGYSTANDISARDWQERTSEWLQGKSFANTTPLGPYLVTPDEAGVEHQVSCDVAGERMQTAATAELVFGPADLLSYISTVFPLEPGDIILTGTPGGVGLAQTPPRFLQDGDVVVSRISGVGECRNRCRRV
jgi:acylpyruvate hydrolase